MIKSHQNKTLKFVLLVTLIALALFSVYFFDLSNLISPSKIKTSILSYGSLAPFVFSIIYVISTIIFLPGTPLTIVGGAIFGTFLGTFYTVIGATIGATIAFLLARYLGASFVEETLKGKYKKLYEYDKKIEENGFLVVLFLRLVPIFPFNGLNFALGLTRIKLGDYIIGTAVGIIPGSFVLAFFGGSLASLNWINIVLATILFILLSFSPKIYKRLRGKKNQNT